MLRIVILALLAVGSFALSRHFPSDGDWESYKSAFVKMYTPKEEAYRRVIFEETRAFVQRHNAEAKEGKHSYTVGINQFADMTSEEFVKLMNGFRQEMTSKSEEVYMRPNNVHTLPTTVDWRTKGYVTEVKNQKQCGSCWAFSATGSLEGQHFRKNGTLVSLSEQNLVDCSGKEGNMGCKGGLIDWAFEYIKKNHGIDTEISYPYEAQDKKCRFHRDSVGATDVGFTDIKKGSETDLQSAVATVGPVSVAIDASHKSFQLYKDGVYDEPQCSSTRFDLDHGVLAVGYGVHEGEDYWLVKNSWGLTWGMQGYIMMSRNKDNQCGIATLASYPRV